MCFLFSPCQSIPWRGHTRGRAARACGKQHQNTNPKSTQVTLIMQHTNRPTKSLRIFETEVAIPPSYGFANRAYKSARLQRKCRTRQDLPQNLKTIALWLTTYRRGPIMAAGPSEYCPRNSRADRHDRRPSACVQLIR